MKILAFFRKFDLRAKAYFYLFCLSLGSLLLFQNFSKNTAPNFNYWNPFVGTGDKLYLNLPKISGGGHALTWDGRLEIASGFFPSPNTLTPNQSPLLSLQPGSQPIAKPNQNLTISNGSGVVMTVVVTAANKNGGVCNLQILQNTTTPATVIFDLFETGQAEPCTNPVLYFNKQGLNFIGTVNNVPQTQMFNVYPGTGGNLELQFFQTSPYVGVLDISSNQLYWTNSVGFSIKLFNAEKLTSIVKHSGENPPSLDTVQSAMNAAVDTNYLWGLPSTEAVEQSYYPGTQIFPVLQGLNSVTITPNHSVNQDGSPVYPINPYYSDAQGNPCINSQNQKLCPDKAQYLTYKMSVISPIYGLANDVNNATLSQFHATAIINNPYSVNATLSHISMDDAPVPLSYPGNNIIAIEPTVTFDGSLLLYQSEGVAQGAGYTFYSFNPTPDNPTTWTAPNSIINLHTDTNPQLIAKAYPLARYPITDAYGNPYTDSCYVQSFGNCLPAAYGWMSPDGSDYFFSAATGDDTNRRAGTSILGSSTKGMIRYLDGSPNINRMGEGHQAIPSNLGNRFYRTMISSPGRTPGQWSPLDFMSNKVLPLTDKLYTYPMFDPPSNSYFEASFEETLIGNYDLYLDMSEALKYNATRQELQSTCKAFDGAAYGPPCYDTTTAQDLSGNFHSASLVSGAYFPPEVPSSMFNSQCTDTGCLLNNPFFSQERNNGQLPLFSGQALYFANNGFVDVPFQSKTGSKILLGANDLTVSLAVMPMSSPSQTGVNIISMNNTFSLILNSDLSFTATINTVVPPSKQITSCSFKSSSALPMNSWSHLAFSVSTPPVGSSGPGGTLTPYVNGLPLANVVSCNFPVGSIPNVTGSDVYLGPNPPGANYSGPSPTYALDQVGISRVVRSPAEIARQAGLVFPRFPENNANANLANGINFKDIRSQDLVSRQLDPGLVAVGQSLFFDTILSATGQVSCSSCHTPGTGWGSATEFSETLMLHPNLLAGQQGQYPFLIRNTPDVTFSAFRDSFFRDGRSPSLLDQVNTVLTNPQEMNSPGSLSMVVANVANSPLYQNLFANTQNYNPNNGVPIQESSIQAALQEFELSLVQQSGAMGPGGSAADRYLAGDIYALTDNQAVGRSLFYGKAHCAQCHSGSALTDNNFHNISFLNPYNKDQEFDAGRFRFTQGQNDYFKFMTPSLRNVSSTGPYEHNGSFPSIRALIANGYNRVTPQMVTTPPNSKYLPQGTSITGEEMLLPIHLSDQEIDQLTDFVSHGLAAPNPIVYPTK